jgi:hypothetical protein
MLAGLLVAGPTPPQSLPTAAPAAGDLPEIGRTQSHAPACVALQEIVAPSFAAAMRADKQFAQTAPQFASYAEAIDNATTLRGDVTVAARGQMKTKLIAVDPDSATPEMYLAKLDKALTGMQQEALTIAKALGDPRIAADVTDPVVQTERRQLQALYGVQSARIKALMEFLEKQRKETGDRTFRDTTAFDSAGVSMEALAAAAYNATHGPEKGIEALGQPMTNGLTPNDKRAVNDWTTAIARVAHDNANAAAKTLLDVAKTCH